MHVTFVGYSWNNQGIFLYSIFLEHYLGVFPGISYGTFPNILGIDHGNVPRIFHEKYSRNIIWEYSRNFIGNSFRILWEYIMGMFHEYSTNIYLPWWVVKAGNKAKGLSSVNHSTKTTYYLHHHH